MDRLLTQQKLLLEQLNKMQSNFKKDAKARKTLAYATKLLQRVQEIRQTFLETHQKILSLVKEQTDLDLEYFKDKLYLSFEELNLSFETDLEDLKLEQGAQAAQADNETQNQSSRSNDDMDVRLPRINLSKFNGNYGEWTSFKDLFVSLIHNKSNLSRVEKLHYLKCSLSGEAEQLLKHYSITESNYNSAWRLLIERYDDKRVLLNTQFRRLLAINNANESASSIKMLLDKTTDSVQAIVNLEVANIWDALLVHLTTQRLPTETRQIWEQQQAAHKETSSFKDLTEFLQRRFRALEAAGVEKHKPTRSSHNVFLTKHEQHIMCISCKGPHHLRQCTTFLQSDHATRFDMVKRNGLCLNCLNKGHLVGNCPSTSRCFKCKKAHHTLLHKPDVSTTGVITQQSQSSSRHRNQTSNSFTQNNLPPILEFNQEPSTSFSHNVRPSTLTSLDHRPSTSVTTVTKINSSTSNATKTVLLATALVTVESSTGFITLRALLDQGSQASIITESAAQRIGGKRQSTNITVAGIGETKGISTNGNLEITLRTKTNEYLKVDALVLRKLTNFIPSQTISTSIRKQIGNLDLADPHFDQPSKIDILLGAEAYAQLLLGKIRKLTLGPVLQLTKLGWIISGRFSDNNAQIVHTLNVKIEEDVKISEQLKHFWKIEEVGKGKNITQEEEACEEHYKANVKRKQNGRYQVRLPFRNPESQNSLGFSRENVIKCLMQMEKRFERDRSLQEEYSAVIQEYISLGHMKEVPVCREVTFESGNKRSTANFLPHHAVQKESTFTKLRVVFDASRKTSSGVSLNDILLTGPTIQSTMTSILIRWRLKQFAMVADIAKMYRQIDMHPEDAKFQKIVWRQQPTDLVKDYVLTTVTFGTTSAPFLAIRTLHQLAIDEIESYPNASKAVFEEFYVDDLLSGGNSLQECIIKRDELIKLLNSGGFKLRKWITNDRRILEGIPSEDIEMQDAINMDMDNGHKSLGIMWYPLADFFTYRLKRHKQLETYTKRSILSEVARLYDPLGWIAPIMVSAKILLQGLWLSGQDWDEPISTALNTEWMTLLDQLPEIENIKIPRWVAYHQKSKIELHGFCDASQRAYAAVIYVVVRAGSAVNSHLLMAKTKVAPVKPVSIPRLELCGAVLLSRLLKEVTTSLKIENIPTWLWSDSEIVLAWLKGHPTRWTTFVSNRTALILENTDNIPWRYVPSKCYPADVASRGVKPIDLIRNELWWHGPSWLSEDIDAWPKMRDIKSVEVEKRKHYIVNVGIHTESFLDTWLQRYSTLSKLIRITAYCFRFCRSKINRIKNPPYLTSEELRHSFEFWIKHAQQSEYSQEIACLLNNKPIEKKSKLIKLNPFIDKTGLIRVLGRLKNAQLSFDERHPIILPRNGRFTELMLHQVHQATLHGQTQLMLNTLRKRFWLIDGRNRIKHFVHKCIRCFRAKANGATQLMGNLPAARVTISRPFTHTGVDFCGPFDIKDRRGRGSKTSKGYVAIFICLVVKAIHIEIVSDLSTQAFLAALRRFIGRRGFSGHMYSDCGTNFVGAYAELNKLSEINKRAAEILANDGVTWHFNPPASPHFGGLWEAGVKSIKSHLRRIVGNIALTYEELSTILIRIEACLNSRPLCPLNDDPTDTTALTPAHFLIGDTLLAPPEADFEGDNINHLDRWQTTQKITQDFWKRWKTEYLNRLQLRPKWNTTENNVKVGDLCILKDEKLPSYRWPLARIIEVHPGNDSLVRVVTVWSNGKTYKRSVTKIALVPTQNTS